MKKKIVPKIQLEDVKPSSKDEHTTKVINKLFKYI